MPRRERIQISLFPFMSILACTIGALMFLLVTMAMSRVEARGGILAEAAQMSSQSRSSEAEKQRREQALVAMAEEAQQLQTAKAQLEILEEALVQKGFKGGGSLIGIQDQLTRRRSAASRQESLTTLEAQLAELESQEGSIETSIAVLESRRETLPILIDPTGLSKRQTPYFVECDEGGVTAYRVRDDFTYFVPKGEISTSGDFGRYLRRIRALPDALLVLLVREDGIATSLAVDRLARHAGIRSARLPLPGDGALDFRLIQAAEAPRP